MRSEQTACSVLIDGCPCSGRAATVRLIPITVAGTEVSRLCEHIERSLRCTEPQQHTCTGNRRNRSCRQQTHCTAEMCKGIARALDIAYASCFGRRVKVGDGVLSSPR